MALIYLPTLSVPQSELRHILRNKRYPANLPPVN
jgi:hypothetical protein